MALLQRRKTGAKQKAETGESGQDSETDADRGTRDATGFLDSYMATCLGVLLCLILFLGGLCLIYYQVFYAVRDSPMRNLRKLMIQNNPHLAGKSDSEILEAAEKFFKMLKSEYSTLKA